MKKTLVIICGGVLFAGPAMTMTCSISSVPASCIANTETCSGGYCTTTYKYTAASQKCTCSGNGCCTCAYLSNPLCTQCPTSFKGVECPLC